jgi:hypothetical protein
VVFERPSLRRGGSARLMISIVVAKNSVAVPTL